MDWKVGEVKEIDGNKYKCIDVTEEGTLADCRDCDLDGCELKFPCIASIRDDCKNVIFKKVE